MADILNLLESYWGLVVGVITAIGGYYTWRIKRQESTHVLMDKLEELKLKFITQISKEIELSEKLAEEKASKNRILEEVKGKCPDCYEQLINDKKLI